MDIEVRGQVISGQGTAAKELLSLQGELLAILGSPLFPGSLNVILNGPLRLRDKMGFPFDDDRRYIWSASLNDVDIWIYRWRHAPLHVVEILCSLNLRKHFNLQNGDRVSLRVSVNKVEKISLLDRFVWAAVWIGRRQACYTDYVYDEAYELASIEFGIAQHQPTKKKPFQSFLWAMKQFLNRIPFIGSASKSIRARSGTDV